MADERGRTAQDREAARLERERRRAERAGSASGPGFPAAPRPEPELGWAERLPASGAAPPANEPVGPASVPAESEPRRPERGVVTDEYEPEMDAPGGAADEYEPGGAVIDEHAPGSDQSNPELPSGTRRVSRSEPPVERTRHERPSGRRSKIRPAARERKPARPARKRTPEQGRRRTWIGRGASLLALALAAGLIWFLVALFQPFGSSPHGAVTVKIPTGSTSNQIGDLLAHDGVIPSSFFFELRATLDGDRGSMRSGVYHLQLGMSYAAALKVLTTAPRAAKTSQLTIAEGRRRQQIASLLHSQGIRGSYLAATRSTKLLNLRAYGLRHPPRSLEGFLFPDTYQLVDPIRISALVTDQLQTFKQQFAKLKLGYAERHHLTPYDVLIIASLIEAETPTAHDRPLVASVIYNRLRDGMTLGLDSTTQYATGNFTRPLTVSQLQSSSPYNTRVHVGLPPTPIGNPGMASMQAAAHPAQTNYLYFFAKPCRPGSVFASNYAQFLALGRRYQSTRC